MYAAAFFASEKIGETSRRCPNLQDSNKSLVQKSPSATKTDSAQA
jgi:hypothetical protein